MTYKAMTSPIALTAAAILSLNSAAFGQTMINGQEITSGDLASVTAHCEMLAGQAPTAANETDGNSGNIEAEDNLPEGEQAEVMATPSPIPADGNEGNIEAEDNLPGGDQTDVVATPAPTAVDANSGNVEARDNVGTLNLQELTLADCQEAGLAS